MNIKNIIYSHLLTISCLTNPAFSAETIVDLLNNIAYHRVVTLHMNL